MGSLFKAHIFKERTRGPREEVKIKLFNLDDSPFELPEVSDTPVTPEVEDWIKIPNSAMSFGWTSLVGSESNYGVKYRKRPDGIVEMSGLAVPGVPGELAFTLPEGYRPTTFEFVSPTFLVPAINTSGGPGGSVLYAIGAVGINANGTVYFVQVPEGTNYINLTSVRFPTD